MTGDLSIGDVAEVLRGTVPANTIELTDGTAFFGLAEVTAGGVLSRSPEPGAPMDRAVTLQTDDVVVALLGRIGDSVLVDEAAAGAVLGRECAALRVRSRESRVLAGWLNVALRSSQVRQQAQRMATGTTMPRLTVRRLGELRIPIPAVEEQRALVERVEKFEAALRAHERAVVVISKLRNLEIDLAFSDVRDGGAEKR